MQQHCCRYGGLQRTSKGGASFRGCIKEPLLVFSTTLLGGSVSLGLVISGNLDKRRTQSARAPHFHSGNVNAPLRLVWTYCRCLRRSLLRSSLMYSDIRPWAKRRKSSVEKNTQEKKAASLCRIINMQYCCHLLASYGSANDSGLSIKIKSWLLIIYPHCDLILSSLWCRLWISLLLPLRCFSPSAQ